MIFNKMIFLHHSAVDPDYLCFTSPNAFSVGMSAFGEPIVPSLEYSKDKVTWTTFTAGTTTISVSADEKVYLRGNNEYINSSYDAYWYFVLTGTDIRASGNIMSLLDSTGASIALTSEYCLACMFEDCASLTTAPALPATTLASYCYSGMFSGCASLTTAPTLPATILASYCYENMFYGCTSLTATPTLHATTLASYCYYCMFSSCTSLTTAPTLPATTLASYCYYCMFSGCTSLTTAPSLLATTLADYCCNYMFYGCTSLTTAPTLPATTLADHCYDCMFYGCASLQVYSSSGEGHTHAWTIPTFGTASSYTSQGYMFYGTTGDYSTASSITLNATFYTQNEPV